MKYNVHLYPVVRVKVINVEADSPQEAWNKADDGAMFDVLFNDDSPSYSRGAKECKVDHIEFIGECDGCRVDLVNGDGDPVESFEFEKDGSLLS